MQNPSGLTPLGRSVLVEMVEAVKADSVIAIPEEVRKSHHVLETEAFVVAVGPVAWSDEPVPRCKVGDKVLVTRMSGYAARGPLDKKLYRLVNDREIFCLVEGGSSHV